MVAIALAQAASAQTGKPFIHDPSTIQECDGKGRTHQLYGPDLRPWHAYTADQDL